MSAQNQRSVDKNSSSQYKEMRDLDFHVGSEKLHTFFDRYTIEEAETALWKWLKIALDGAHDDLNGKERESFLGFYEDFRTLLEGSWAIQERFILAEKKGGEGQ